MQAEDEEASAGEPGPCFLLPFIRLVFGPPAAKACFHHKDYDLPLLETALKILDMPQGQA